MLIVHKAFERIRIRELELLAFEEKFTNIMQYHVMF